MSGLNTAGRTDVGWAKAAIMHIFVVMASGARGGGANHLLALLPALKNLGITCSAWVGDDGPLAEQLVARGIDAEPRPMMRRRGDVILGRACMEAARKSGAQLVHAHGTRAAVLTSLGALAIRRPLPRIYTAHGLAHRAGRSLPSRGFRLAGEWLACRGTSALISVSAADLDVLRTLPRGDCAPSYHVPNVVLARAPVGTAPARKRAARARVGLPQDRAIVGTVCRLVPQKNVVALADAVALMPHVHLCVVGDGPDRNKLQSHPLMQWRRMHLLGARDDVPDILPGLDVFALSSLWEGEPIALLEAMAFGLPWAATATMGAQELQRSCHVGTVTPQRSPHRLAQGLQRFLDNPKLCLAEGERGRQAMQSRTPAALANTLYAIYEQVLAPAAR